MSYWRELWAAVRDGWRLGRWIAAGYPEAGDDGSDV